MFVSQGEVARIAGVTAMAISKAVKEGRLDRVPEGIDLKAQKTIDYIAAHKKSPALVGKKKGSKKHELSRSEQKRLEIQIAAAARPPAAGPSEINGETFNLANLRDKIASAHLKEQKLAQQRGQLIQRSLIHAFLSKLYAVDTAQFLTRGDRMAAIVSGAARSAASDDEATINVNKLLSDDSYREQEQKKDMIREFLRSMKIEDDVTNA